MFLEVANSFGLNDTRALDLTANMLVKLSREAIECKCCFRVNGEAYINCLIKYSLDYELAAEREFLMFHFGRIQMDFPQMMHSLMQYIPEFFTLPETEAADVYKNLIRERLFDPSKYN